MANTVRPEDLASALEQQLTIYSQAVEDSVETATMESMDDLVRKTKATAPVGKRGKFRKQIAGQKLDTRRGSKYVWYVKAPDYRLTHLIVHGHATKNGGRTKSNPFLQNALDQVLPEYEAKIKEAITNAGN